MGTPLPDAERERYSRQLRPEVLGEDGQERLRGSRALVVGLGALGGVVAPQLVAAGAGHLGVVDPGAVGLDVLHRQALHYTPDVGRNKADNAASKLGFLNPAVQVDAYPARLEAANAEALATGFDLVVDCANDSETSLAAEAACRSLDVPLLSAAVAGTSGWVAAVRGGRSVCLRCASKALRDTDAKADGQEVALGPVAGVVGSLQALWAIEHLAGIRALPEGRALRVCAGVEVREVAPARSPDCPVCAASGVKAAV